MYQSKLVDVIKELNSRQLRRLEDWVASPYYNKSEEVLALFIAIKQAAPKFLPAKLKKEKIYQKAFPKSVFEEKKLGYLMSDLLKLTEQFLANEKFEEDTVLHSKYTLESYTELGLDKHYRKTRNDAEKYQEQYPFREAAYFYNEFLLNTADNQHFDKQRKHALDNSLQKAIDNLDLYYLTLKLKHSCEIFNRQNVVAADYELRLLDEILLYVKDKDFEQAPAIAIYYQILMTLMESDMPRHFDSLTNLLEQHADKFPQKEARDMYAYAQNYCIKKINKGNEEYIGALFELYKTTLSKKIIFDGPFLSPWSFRNIVGIALRVKKYDWAQQFIEDYRNSLREEFRENVVAYNLANLEFNRKNYNRALELLRDLEFTDLFYSLDTKAMLLRIYYEMEEVDALHSLLDSFKAYITRSKVLSDYQRTVHLNLVKFVKEATRISKGDKQKAEQLLEKIKTAKQVAYSLWLQQKVEELK